MNISNKEKTFNFRNFWGSKELASHVIFRRNSVMYCVYCGNKADMREHCPAKAFLKKLFPNDLQLFQHTKSAIMGFLPMRDILKK